DDNTAALLLVGGSVPADDEAILRDEKIGALVEIDQVVGIALEALLVFVVFAAGELDQPLARAVREHHPPALELPLVAVAAAQDFRDLLGQLERIPADAAQDEGAPVRRQREPESERRLPAAGLSAVEQLVRQAFKGIVLRSLVGCPTEPAGCR